MNFSIPQLAELSAFNRNGKVPQSNFAKKIKPSENPTTLGIMNEQCAIVMSHKLNSVSNFSFPDPDSNDRVKIIRDHMGAVISGRLPDALVMLDEVRRTCVEYRSLSGAEITMQTLATTFKQPSEVSTINVNSRHLGASIIVASYEVETDKPWLYKLQSDTAAKWQNVYTSGAKSKKALKFLRAAPEANFATQESLIKLGMKCLNKVSKISSALSIELGIVSKENPEFRIMRADEIANYFHAECAAVDENAADADCESD